mgnify:CR=1 FL=1
MFRALHTTVLLFLALVVMIGCSPSCEECSDDYDLHFKFVNEEGDEILTDGSKLRLTDKLNNEFSIDREGTETDTAFVVSLIQPNPDIPEPDTIIFFYENAIIDSASVKFGFQRDSDCCFNPRIVENITLFNLESARLIKREFDIYRITVE